MTDDEMIKCAEPSRQIERLCSIMHRLRAPGGCPWDAEQTHESLVSNLIEETYETVAAIRANDEENLQEELGDLLLQVVFHAELAKEERRFDLNDIARSISDKLVRRHPHVYGDSNVSGTDGVLAQWEDIKRAEKGHEEKPIHQSDALSIDHSLNPNIGIRHDQHVSTRLRRKVGKLQPFRPSIAVFAIAQQC